MGTRGEHACGSSDNKAVGLSPDVSGPLITVLVSSLWGVLGHAGGLSGAIPTFVLRGDP